MSTLLQPGQHPDADQLTAFAEHALPAHEQQQTLAHLAACADCRALVFLTQQGEPDIQPQAAPTPAQDGLRGWLQLENWLSGWRIVLQVAALACLVLLTLYLRRTPRQTTPPTSASIHPPAPQPAPVEAPLHGTNPPAAPLVRQPHREQPKRLAPPPVTGVMTATATPPPTPGPVVASSLSVRERQLASPLPRNQAAFAAQGGVTGTILDAAGLAVAHATVTATNTDTGVQETRTTNATGNYSITPLQPGNYNVEVVAPGFKRMLQENVTVDATAIARVEEKLSVGGADTTVTITDAPPFLDTADATLGGTIENQLYSDLPLTMNGGPRDPTSFQYLMPGVQEKPATATTTNVASNQPAANASGQSSGNSGIYGGSGQTNLNQNYINGVPVATIGQQGNGTANLPAAKVATATTGAAIASANVSVSAIDQFSVRSLAAQAAPIKPLPPLPTNLPMLSVVRRAGLTLALDTAGALFRLEAAASNSAASSAIWHLIPTQWSGRALTLRLAPQPAATAAAPQPQAGLATNVAFQLTTDTGLIYTSTDGQTWQRN
jgi:hypothetical protein